VSDLSTVKTQIQIINAAVTGIAKSHEGPPMRLVTAQLPLVFPIVTSFEIAYQTASRASESYVFDIKVFGDPTGQNIDTEARIAALEPFIALFRNAYAAHITLSGNCEHAFLTGGTFEVQYGHAVLVMQLEVKLATIVVVAD